MVAKVGQKTAEKTDIRAAEFVKVRDIKKGAFSSLKFDNKKRDIRAAEFVKACDIKKAPCGMGALIGYRSISSPVSAFILCLTACLM